MDETERASPSRQTLTDIFQTALQGKPRDPLRDGEQPRITIRGDNNVIAIGGTVRVTQADSAGDA